MPSYFQEVVTNRGRLSRADFISWLLDDLLPTDKVRASDKKLNMIEF